MAKVKKITAQALSDLVKKLIAGGASVIAPVKKGDRIVFDAVDSIEKASLDQVQTDVSAKETVFPRYETILKYHNDKSNVVIDGNPPAVGQTVVIGTRPCDARAFAVMDAVFLGEPADEIYKSRREALIIISASCSACDEFCFCTSVNGSPGGIEGSDILLTKIDGGYAAESGTDRGADIINKNSDLFKDLEGFARENYITSVPVKFSADELKSRLSKCFEDEIWLEQSLRCIGCGVCAYVCPTCSCFDIQDEAAGAAGTRLRCWDACGFSQFTVHTSWHNPRDVQSERWRQRIMHKFSYQPECLNLPGCVGCGRCSRACPADMNILGHCINITEKINV